MGGTDAQPLFLTLAAASVVDVAQADLFGKDRTLSGIVGSDHWIVCRQTPFPAVFFGCHTVSGTNVALQHLEALTVLETDDVLGRHGLLDRDRGLLTGGRPTGDAEIDQRLIN